MTGGSSAGPPPYPRPYLLPRAGAKGPYARVTA